MQVHDAKTRVSDKNKSIFAFSQHHIITFANSCRAIGQLQPEIGNQPVDRLTHSNNGFDFAEIGIQPKLRVSQHGDVYEQEADRVAEHVMRMSETVIQTLDTPPPNLRKKEQLLPPKQFTDRSASLTQTMGSSVAPIFDEVSNSAGQSLDSKTIALFERLLGYDFSRVRIHTDHISAQSADDVNALAYAVGSDVVFGPGQYEPETPRGKKLLIHELVHVVQQSHPERTYIDQGYRRTDPGQSRTSGLQISAAPKQTLFRSPNGRGELTAAQAELLVAARKKLNAQGTQIVGVLIAEDGRQFEFISGGGKGGADFAIHIEGRATAKMNELGIKRATLIVEKTPCQICDRSWYPGEIGPESPLISTRTGNVISRQTPRINSSLPAGYELKVIDPESGLSIYRGTGPAPKSAATLRAPSVGEGGGGLRVGKVEGGSGSTVHADAPHVKPTEPSVHADVPHAEPTASTISKTSHGSFLPEMPKVSPVDAAMVYLDLHAEHFKRLAEVKERVEIAKDLIKYVDELESGALQLEKATNELWNAEAKLPLYPLQSGEGFPTAVSQDELSYVKQYGEVADSINKDVGKVSNEWDQIIGGWDAVVKQAYETGDFTRQATVEAITMLDLRFSKKGGSFRGFLVNASNRALVSLYSSWQKKYNAADILGKELPDTYKPPSVPPSNFEWKRIYVSGGPQPD